MKKKQARGKQELQSLIPSVESAEKRLDGRLADERAGAERMVRDAEAQAAARIQAAQADLPRLLQEEREARTSLLRQEAEAAGRTLEEETRALEGAAASSLDGAVAWIVSLVWPGGGG
jgi:hypothetical protein